MRNLFDTVQKTRPVRDSRVVRSLVDDSEVEVTNPQPESYRPRGYEYQRGPNVHGGPDSVELADPRGYDDVVPVNLDPPVKRPEPVPVVIVHDDDTNDEILRWNASSTLAGNMATQIVNRLRSRTSLRIKNNSATLPVYVGPDPSVSVVNGWLLTPGTDVTITSTEAVWAIAPTAAATENAPLAVLTHYAVDVS